MLKLGNEIPKNIKKIIFARTVKNLKNIKNQNNNCLIKSHHNLALKINLCFLVTLIIIFFQTPSMNY